MLTKRLARMRSVRLALVEHRPRRIDAGHSAQAAQPLLDGCEWRALPCAGGQNSPDKGDTVVGAAKSGPDAACIVHHRAAQIDPDTLPDENPPCCRNECCAWSCCQQGGRTPRTVSFACTSPAPGPRHEFGRRSGATGGGSIAVQPGGAGADNRRQSKPWRDAAELSLSGAQSSKPAPNAPPAITARCRRTCRVMK